MSEYEILTQAELATRWRMNPGTLAVWRSLKKGPAYNKFGGKVMYALVDVIAFENQNKINHEEEKNDL